MENIPQTLLKGVKDALGGILDLAKRAIGYDEHNSYVTYSSGEEIECDSDCSLCASDNKSISLLSSSRSSIQRSLVP